MKKIIFIPHPSKTPRDSRDSIAQDKKTPYKSFPRGVNVSLKGVGFILLLLTPFFIVLAQNQPNNIDFSLSWSTNTYIPPEYQGKSLPIKNSLVQIIAIPTNRANAANANLKYNWYLDDIYLKDISGINKSFFYFRADKKTDFPYKIELRIFDKSNQEVFRKTISIKTVKPEVYFSYTEVADKQIEKYSKDNTIDFNQIESELNFSRINPNDFVINNTAGKPQKFVYFLAQPYFFNISNPQNLEFIWELDDNLIYNSKYFIKEFKARNPNFMKITVQEFNKFFNQKLSVAVENADNESEKAENDLNIQFFP